MAYVSSVITPLPKVERIGRNLGMLVGKCAVSTYDTTLLEITGITKYFVDVGNTATNCSWGPKGVFAVTPSGPSSNGHLFSWDATTGAFKCLKPTSIIVTSTIGGGPVTMVINSGGSVIAATSANATYINTAIEVVAGVDCGTCSFIAIGFIR
jgi:hypothetical protein